MIDPAVLRGRARYERVLEGRVDNTHDDALTHTVTLADADFAVEVVVVALPSPAYEIREARGRVLRGPVDPAALAGLTRLAGARLIGGLTRRAVEATGSGAGAGLLVVAVVEVARLARQVARLPRARAEQAIAGGPWGCWQLDAAAWSDLPDSCFTYTEAGRQRFATETVTAPVVADIYSPRPGQPNVFARRKVARLERAGDHLSLLHSMHDNVHGFEIRYEIDLATGVIVGAESDTPRLPYRGICDEPQAKISSLLGETADAGLAQRIQTHLGGTSGCAQLYDLTADLLKLLAVTPGRAP